MMGRMEGGRRWKRSVLVEGGEGVEDERRSREDRMRYFGSEVGLTEDAPFGGGGWTAAASTWSLDGHGG